MASNKHFLTNNRQRVIYIIMPLLILLLVLGIINVVSGALTNPSAITGHATTATPSTLTAVPLPISIAATQETAVLPTTTTPTESPTLSPTRFTFPATATPYPGTSEIVILGPPENGRFVANTALSIYWQWPHPLTPEQVFTVYLQQEAAETFHGQVVEPNFGKLFQIQIKLPEIDSGTLIIKLQHENTGEIFRASSPRTIQILSRP